MCALDNEISNPIKPDVVHIYWDSSGLGLETAENTIDIKEKPPNQTNQAKVLIQGSIYPIM